jgi:hypothetical protein
MATLPHAKQEQQISQKRILRDWPVGGPEILWTVSNGSGYGGPIMKEGKVYLIDRDDKTGDIIRCFDFFRR